ncbi:MAG: DUF881 domain-containing protein [Anaerolineae bacterium]
MVARAGRRWLVLGVVVVAVAASATVLAQRQPPEPVRIQNSSSVDAELVAALLAANDSLRDEMERLDRQISEASSGSNVGRLEGMAGALNSLRIVNGSVAAVGPGVQVRVSGSFSAATIRDVVNELKSGGAEALSVNGRRLTLWSAIYQGRESVLLDGYHLGSVVTIEAIGDASTLAEVLQRRGGLISLLQDAGVSVQITEKTGVDEVRLPMAAEQQEFAHARVP